MAQPMSASSASVPIVYTTMQPQQLQQQQQQQFDLRQACSKDGWIPASKQRDGVFWFFVIGTILLALFSAVSAYFWWYYENTCLYACESAADCASHSGTTACSATLKRCVECASSTDCASKTSTPKCDTTLNKCVACLADTDCGTGKKCSSGACV